MAPKDEISSTEKLLDLIRGTPSSAAFINTAGPVAPPPKTGLLKALTFQKTIGIGVEIGTDEIKVAKINRISDKSVELMDYASVAVERMEKTDSPRAAKALAAILAGFCTGLKHYDIWCCVPSAKVETRCTHIPKLPKKQIPNAVFWTFSKEVDFSNKEMLLDFRILGDVQESGMTKTQVMTFTIPIAETDSLKRLFAKAGYPLSGVSIVPFAIQNLLTTGIVQRTGGNTCCLFIGKDWSRITIYTEGNLILSRGIKAGMSSMIEAIAEHHRQTAPNDVPAVTVMADRNMEPAAEPDAAFAAARQDFYRFLDADGTAGRSADSQDRQPVDIFRTILPAVERLVKQVERTIAHFAMHFKGSAVSQILISGKMTASAAVMAHVGSQLGLLVKVLNPFPQPHPFTRKVKIPDAPEAKERFVPAIGMGISSNEQTPNFLFTYRHREKRDRLRRLRIGISASEGLPLLQKALKTAPGSPFLLGPGPNRRGRFRPGKRLLQLHGQGV